MSLIPYNHCECCGTRHYMERPAAPTGVKRDYHFGLGDICSECNWEQDDGFPDANHAKMSDWRLAYRLCKAGKEDEARRRLPKLYRSWEWYVEYFGSTPINKGPS